MLQAWRLVLLVRNAGYSNYPTFNSPDSLATSLKNIGIDVISTAGNHCLDMGFNGLSRTIDVLDNADISHLGTYKSQEDQDKILYKYVKGVNLAGNVGHQNALWAGMTVAKDYADIVVSIDADLQDDVLCIKEMVKKYQEGYDIVYGVRNERKTDTWFKKHTALAFYKLMELMGTKTVYNHADFRLMSKRAVEYLLLFRERNLFIRGLVPLVGYKTTKVYYDRAERFAGESKYPLSKMLNFAIDGITSFSVKPIRLILALGIIFLLVALAVLCWTLYSYMKGNVVAGWSSLMLSVWFCSGCVLTCMGVVGEYIGKIYVESKERPRFNIETILIADNNE